MRALGLVDPQVRTPLSISVLVRCDLANHSIKRRLACCLVARSVTTGSSLRIGFWALRPTFNGRRRRKRIAWSGAIQAFLVLQEHRSSMTRGSSGLGQHAHGLGILLA